MRDFRFLWSRAVTRFDLADKARVHNIRLAVQKLDGQVLPPGATLSFNQAVGSRQKADSAFEPAPVFSDKGRVRALGGGVCQVSSTLYSAVLLTDLQVHERHAHAMPVPYLTPGLDATISNVLDLKIRNPHPFALQIRMNVEGRRLEAEVWAEQASRQNVRISRTASRCFKDGVPALQVVVWRIYGNGQREKMSEDVYYLGR